MKSTLLKITWYIFFFTIVGIFGYLTSIIDPHEGGEYSLFTLWLLFLIFMSLIFSPIITMTTYFFSKPEGKIKSFIKNEIFFGDITRLWIVACFIGNILFAMIEISIIAKKDIPLLEAILVFIIYVAIPIASAILAYYWGKKTRKNYLSKRSFMDKLK